MSSPFSRVIPTKWRSCRDRRLCDVTSQSFTYTRWRQKPTGIDMEQNYVIVTLCIVGHTEAYRYRCSEWRHCVVVRRPTPLLRRIGCVVSYGRRRAPRLDESIVQGVPPGAKPVMHRCRVSIVFTSVFCAACDVNDVYQRTARQTHRDASKRRR